MSLIRKPRRPADPPVPGKAVGLLVRLSPIDRDKFAVIAAQHRQSMQGRLRQLVQDDLARSEKKSKNGK